MLFAQMRLDMANDILSAEKMGKASLAGSGDVSGDVARLFDAARAALAPFDPVAIKSALLARIRYQLVPLIAEGSDRFGRWYVDWTTLAPRAWDAHGQHARHLLPEWFGTGFGMIDHAAREACQRLDRQTGAAPYAIFMASAARHVPSIAAEMDLALFLKGVEDYCRVDATQENFNRAGDMLWSMANRLNGPDEASRQRGDQIAQALDRLFRSRIRELHVASWQGDINLMLDAVSASFAIEIHSGARIMAGVEGLEARWKKMAA
jgi:hypothetical protein